MQHAGDAFQVQLEHAHTGKADQGVLRRTDRQLTLKEQGYAVGIDTQTEHAADPEQLHGIFIHRRDFEHGGAGPENFKGIRGNIKSLVFTADGQLAAALIDKI